MTPVAASRPNVFSIPPGEPFLDVLVERLLDGSIIPGFPDASDPLSLPRATVLLPTRRACRALEEAFARIAGPALLLPRIRPIGEVDEDELDFADAGDEGDDGADGLPSLDLPAVIRPLQRRVQLTRLVLAWARSLKAQGIPVLVPASPADAAFLAGELARLMDTMSTEGRPWSALEGILPRELQAHWEITVRFLSIATEAWPNYLAATGTVEPAERRRRLLEAEAARLSRLPPAPVIAAGSTGSIPATAHLLATVATLPRGAVVLPGLDRDLDAASWDLLERGDLDKAEPIPSHPQTAMRHLLRAMNRLDRADVRVLTSTAGIGPDKRARERLMSEVMRPAGSTDAWSGPGVDREALARGLAGVSLIEAATEIEEAAAIALCLREALEVPGRTAALVTPDRVLARRVAAEMARFGVTVDDTSGRPLSETPAGVFARLVAEAARSALDPVGLMALLQHPMAQFGLRPTGVRLAARALERLALRGPPIPPGVAGLTRVVDAGGQPTQAAKGLQDEERGWAEALAQRIAEVFAPFERVLAAGNDLPALTLLDAHVAALTAIARTDRGGSTLDATEDGRAMRLFLDEMADAGLDGLSVPPAEYPALFDSLMGGRTVRRTGPSDARLKIYGLLEARLIRADRVVLAGLVEGVWPAATRTDPWLSRAMRTDMALPAPERRIGLAAHDLAQGMGADEVVLTRAMKRGGAPSVPSRWLQRMEAVVGPAGMAAIRARGRPWTDLARRLDEPPGPAVPIARPAPTPPLGARPRRLSVTEIETLVRDPYSIYARHVLRLRPFEAIAEDVSGADKGSLIHDIFAAYARQVTVGGAEGPDALLALGRAAFRERNVTPALTAFWWPRFERMAHWFAGFDAQRRANGARVLVEVSGKILLTLAGGPFELVGRADRIEQGIGGEVSVIDFKTGQLPTAKSVRAGFSPQLPLEAAMILKGGFAEDGLAPGLSMAELLYVGLRGAERVAETRTIAPEAGSVDAFAEDTLGELVKLLTRFDDPSTGYASLAASRWRLTYGRYDHLARVREWGVASEGIAE